VLGLGTRAAGELVRVANDARGIASLRKRLYRLTVARVILEASGGLETALVAELGAARLPVIVVNPRRRVTLHGLWDSSPKPPHSMRAYRSCSVNSYARNCAIFLRPRSASSKLWYTASGTRRNDHRERNWLSRMPRLLHKEILAHKRWLEQRLDRDRELAGQFHRSPLWREREELLGGVPGVGPILCATLLAEPPELDGLDRLEIAKLVRVAPLNRDCGTCVPSAELGADARRFARYCIWWP
jgi:transposase